MILLNFTLKVKVFVCFQIVSLALDLRYFNKTLLSFIIKPLARNHAFSDSDSQRALHKSKNKMLSSAKF